MTQIPQNIEIADSDGNLIRGTHRFSHKAMATIFEIFILHEDASYAQQAAYEAFEELDRLEQELSRFIENSDISRINNLDANRPVRVGLAAFECLKHSARIYEDTDGAFDITIGTLLKCWLNQDKTLRIPSEEKLNVARQHTGMHLLQLDEAQHTVRLLTSPVHVDLGGFGKGYAVDVMAELLRDWSIDSALIHGGSSSVLALGTPPGIKGWPLTVSSPSDRKQTLACLHLQEQALSGSGLQKGQHIIDPRTAKPVKGKCAAWASAPNAATTDALSTAFMIMTPDEIKNYCLQHQDVRAMIVLDDSEEESEKDKILRYGLWDDDELFSQNNQATFSPWSA